jgi:thiol-disulfide isomerase/thioredoxin
MSRRSWIGFVVAACAMVVPASFARAEVKVGDKPTLEFKSANGGTAESLAKYKGKIIVVDFWATWCGPCMAEADHMVKLNSTYAPRGLQFIGVSLDKDVQAMLTVSKQKAFNWPQYCDGTTSATSGQWGVDSIPRTFIIGPDGSLLWTGHPAQIDQALAAAFKDHPPRLVDPKVMAEAVAAATKIEETLKTEGGEAAALKLLAKVPAEAKKDDEMKARLTAIEGQLEAYANKAIAEVDPLIADKKYMEAAAKLNDLSKSLGSLPAGAAAKKKLAEVMANPATKAQFEAAARANAADEELAIANRLKGEKKDEQAYVKFRTIAATFAGTPAGETAKAEVANYDATRPEIGKKAADAAVAGKAKMMMGLAENYAKVGKDAQAIAKFQEVVTAYPGTAYAKDAQKAIDDIKAKAPK